MVEYDEISVSQVVFLGVTDLFSNNFPMVAAVSAVFKASRRV